MFLSHVGLEAQLLGIVVRKERPELEEQKDMLVRSIASGKKKLQQLEDEILRSVDMTSLFFMCSILTHLSWIYH